MPRIPSMELSDEDKERVKARQEWMADKLSTLTERSPLVVTPSQIIEIMISCYVQGYGDASLRRMQGRQL